MYFGGGTHIYIYTAATRMRKPSSHWSDLLVEAIAIRPDLLSCSEYSVNLSLLDVRHRSVSPSQERISIGIRLQSLRGRFLQALCTYVYNLTALFLRASSWPQARVVIICHLFQTPFIILETFTFVLAQARSVRRRA